MNAPGGTTIFVFLLIWQIKKYIAGFTNIEHITLKQLTSIKCA
jgi:hypothetical protein